MAYTTLYELKRHLQIEEDFIDDDGYLQDLQEVATIAVDNYLNNSISGYTTTTIPMPIKQAALLLAGHYYVTRQVVSFGQGYEIPLTFRFLLDPYKNYTVL